MDSSNSTDARGSAFGLALEADFPLPGLPAAAVGPPLPRVELRRVDEAEIAASWPDTGTERLSAAADAMPDRTIDAHPRAGYRLHARYFGLCLVTSGGERLLCAPPPVPSWRWQRFLVGRCLPFTALLRGYEVFHAGAVEVDGGVVAIVGPRGAGKTSLTLHLMLQGARFFTDDVLAVDATGLTAHPGFGVMNVRVREYERLGGGLRARLGASLGQTGHDKLHFAVSPAAGPLPWRTLFFVVPGTGDAATVRPLANPDATRLLASTFIHESRTPAQLAHLLDVCARISAGVSMFEVALGTREDAARLATRLRARLATDVAA